MLDASIEKGVSSLSISKVLVKADGVKLGRKRYASVAAVPRDVL